MSDYDYVMKISGFATYFPFILQMTLYITNFAEDIDNERKLILSLLNNQLPYLCCGNDQRENVSDATKIYLFLNYVSKLILLDQIAFN